jgi:hypothetical protein
MGVVRVEQAGSWYFAGDSITQSVVCLYCDRCGSFQISKRIALRIILLIAGTVFLGLFVWLEDDPMFRMGFAVFAILFEFLLIYSVLSLGYKCKKCGNTEITKNKNALNYPDYDKSILDIPIEDAVKFIADDY